MTYEGLVFLGVNFTVVLSCCGIGVLHLSSHENRSMGLQNAGAAFENFMFTKIKLILCLYRYALIAVLSCLPIVRARAQTPAAPAPDPNGPANIFYGDLPAQNASTAPIVVFIHGWKGTASDWWSASDMYASAWAAGYRTAFVSLNADNSRNNTPWGQNGINLKPLLTRIATHYSGSSFYVVAHSKGGLDMQAALLTVSNGKYAALDPTIAALVKSVFLLGTPNQGTPLADWAFTSGGTNAQQLGLTGTGLHSLEVGIVKAFRAQADPILAKAGIQFYTFAGDTAGTNTGLQATAKIIAGIVSGPNDGFVPVTYVPLTYSYSMSLGRTGSNSYQLTQGHVSFGLIDGIIRGLQSQTPGFTKIVTGGFGDNSNTYAWSIQWFKHKLYVGTGREVNCVTAFVLATGPHSGRSNCPNDPKDLRLAAEIWQYTPETKTWARVYQSPLDIPVGNDSANNPIVMAHDIGYRGMAVFTEADGTQALYVAGVGAGELFANLAPYSTSGYPPPRILRSVDGVNFAPIPQDPGTFLGNITLNAPAGSPVWGFRTMAVLNGKLFVTATDYSGIGYVIASSNPSAGNDAWFPVSPPETQMPIFFITPFNNRLYSAGGDNTGYFVAYTDATGTPPYTWTRIIDHAGYGGGNRIAMSMQVFNNQLYVGDANVPAIELIRINPDNTWDLVVGSPRPVGQISKKPVSGIGESFDNQWSAQVWWMDVVPSGRHQGLYLGTFNWSTLLHVLNDMNTAVPDYGASLFRTPDGVNWSSVTNIGFGDGYNYGFRTLKSTPFGIFAGTARLAGGFHIWLDQSVLDLNGDGVIDQNDVNIIAGAVGQAASGPNDARDLDEDGQITSNDVQLLTTQCSVAGCGVQPPPAPITVLAPTNVASLSNSSVSLTWTPVPGALKYRVYRQTQLTVPNYFPNTLPGTIVSFYNATFTFPQDVLSGSLNTLCPQGLTSPDQICKFFGLIQLGYEANSGIGFPTPPVYLGTTTSTSYQEAPASALQSVYFVRAEDAQGNLSEPSNLAAAPSF